MFTSMIPIPPELDREARPPYPDQHNGPCAVVAMGPGAALDYHRMIDHFDGEIPVRIGVRRAALYFDVEHVYSLDREKLAEIGYMTCNEKPVIFHSGQPAATKQAKDYPWIDHWWPGTIGAGTSAWGATRMSAFMGFNPIILAGVPLVPGDYDDGTPAPTFQDMKVITPMRQIIERDTWLHPYVRSMSGWTREFLGAP